MDITERKENDILIRIIVIVSLISLFFSVTNVVPLSALTAIMIIFIPFLFFYNISLHSVSVSLLLMLLYYAFSTLVYAPDSFLNYNFYRRDGNVFITYAPLIVLSMLKINLNVDIVIRLFLYFATALNFLLMIVYSVTGGTIFFYEPGMYHFLFEAHNAAGGFLATLSAFCIGYYAANKKWIYLTFSIINCLGLYLSDSRGSILAIVLAVFIVLFFNRKLFKTIIVVMMIAIQITMLSWLYTNSSPAAFLNNEQFSTDNISLDNIERGGTIIIRGFYLWPRAIYLFLHSPVFGTGFGSFNDRPYSLTGEKYLFEQNETKNLVFSDSHAHHTFLHILAETGVVGLIFLLFFLFQLSSYINFIPNAAIRNAMNITLWVSILSSFTEHRLFTPSQMLPFTILMGLTIAVYRRQYTANRFEKGGERVCQN